MSNLLDRDSIRTAWLRDSTRINATYTQAAIEYANNMTECVLDGTSKALYVAEFDCSVQTRNKLLSIAATELLGNSDNSVHNTDCFVQYNEGLITATECCNYLLTH